MPAIVVGLLVNSAVGADDTTLDFANDMVASDSSESMRQEARPRPAPRSKPVARRLGRLEVIEIDIFTVMILLATIHSDRL